MTEITNYTLWFLEPKCGFWSWGFVNLPWSRTYSCSQQCFSGTSPKGQMDHERPNDGKSKPADTLLIPTTRVVHERNVAVAEGCQMIVLTQTRNLACFSVGFYQ